MITLSFQISISIFLSGPVALFVSPPLHLWDNISPGSFHSTAMRRFAALVRAAAQPLTTHQVATAGCIPSAATTYYYYYYYY
jgi:hypothetical protein